MTSYRGGVYYGKKDDEWQTDGVENGSFGIVIDGGVRCFDESNSEWLEWASGGGGGGGGGGGDNTVYRGTLCPDPTIGNDGDIYIQSYTQGTLTSDGDSYINSSFLPGGRASVECVYKVVQTDANYSTIFGTRQGNNARCTARYQSDQNGFLVLQKSTSVGASYNEMSCQFITKSVSDYVRIKISGPVFYAQTPTARQWGLAGSSASADTFGYPVYIFANNNAGSPGDYGSFALKYWAAWNNDGTLARYYVPVEDDNGPGLMDLVYGTIKRNGGPGTLVYTSEGTQQDAIVWEKRGQVWKIVGTPGLS